MHYIDPATVPHWKEWQEYWIPSSLDTLCPHCNKPVALEVTPSAVDHQLQSLGILGRCPRCSNISKIWLAGIRNRDTNPGCEQIWMLPKPTIREIAIQADVLPFPVFDAYREAVGCFNAGFWRAAVTECGRAIEGITQYKLLTDEERQKIGLWSEKHSRSEEWESVVGSALFKPILLLSKAIRLGRITGPHFNFKGETDKKVAEEVLDLTEYIIRYFYILPLQVMNLESTMNELGDTDSKQEAERTTRPMKAFWLKL
jgi:hypothetical protein